ncbi:MAG TPA: signal peptidase I [Candidatus Saccharimonadales bacterium]|nr:signal peptidase I [Candidatus Saccharimonadales bacterium]
MPDDPIKPMPHQSVEPEPASRQPAETTEPRPSHTTARRRHRRRWHDLFANLSVFVIAPLLAIVLTLFVFQSYQVDGISMQNTFQNGDRLIVWKGTRTWDHIFGKQYLPGRGDIVVVNQASLIACGQSEGKQIVKRIIGLPGDHVVFKNGRYTVYNATHPQGFNPDTTLPYGQTGTGLLSDPDDSNTVDLTLSRTQLFVSGDHRSDSCDSRYFGPVESSTIVGKVVMRIFPLSDAERF